MDLSAKQIELFWAKVQKQPFGCWTWTGAKNKGGYGNVRINRVYLGAHRVAYLIAYGYIGPLHVLHTCDNPSCVRPSHLFLGTHVQNVEDMKAKGRARPGPPARLNKIKKRCIHGHRLSGANLYVRPNGDRGCRTCRKQADRRYKRRQAAKSL